MQKKKRKIWRGIKKFLHKYGFPLMIILFLVGWGLLTKWWNMTVLSIVLVLCITVLFGHRAQLIRDVVIAMLIMIPILENKIKALSEFSETLEEETIRAVAKLEKEVSDLVRNEQLFQGVDAEGREIQPPYTAFTRRIKSLTGQPTDRVTLLDTGDFYRSIIPIYGNKDFFIIAYDEKRAKLQAKYGKDILGLNESSRDILSQKLKPVLIDELRKKVL